MITDEMLEEMIDEWQDNCLVNRDSKGKLTRVSNEWYGLLWIKEKGQWQTIELIKGAKENESEIWSSL